ncbi:polymer-forming cytoskeletal protein [bacterium]|nr:polymer-forming cytoskeletal protein [candidate division CSSED10-310 bacterium]
MLTIFRTSKDRGNQPEESGNIPGIPPQPTPVYSQPQPAMQPQPAPVPRRIDPVPTVPAPVSERSNGFAGSTTIGKDLVFEGSVKGKGSIRVEGEFKGTLEVQNEVIIGQGGSVTGDIIAEVVTVEGHLKGNVEARQKININVTGTMIGDIVAPRVVVASGAVYKGRIDMEAALKKQTIAREQQQKQVDRKPSMAPVKNELPKSKPEGEKSETAQPIPGPPPKN